MPEDLLRPSVLIPGFCLFVLLWAGSIGAAYYDLKGRAVPRGEKRAWLALVGLLPGLGFAAYMVSRLLGLVFPLPPAGAPSGQAKKRITLLKEAPAAAPRTGTIALADLIKETIPERAMRPLPSSAFIVTVVAGPHDGDKFVVETLPARLGRGGEATLRLDRDRGVSRQHAEIYRGDGALRIRDLRSTHGTYVNGMSVSDHVLEPGDRIEVGRSTLIVTGEAA